MEAEDRIRKVEDRMVEINETERKKRIKRNEDNLRDLWENVKRQNIQIIGVPEEEDKRKGHGKIFEDIIVKNFPDKGKETATQIQEARRVHENRNQKKIGVAILISDKKQTLK